MAVTVHTRDWDERNAVAPRLDTFARKTVNGRTYSWQLAQDAYGYFWVSQQTGEGVPTASYRRKTLAAVVRYAEDAKFTVTLGLHDQNLPATDPATGLPEGWVHTPVPTVPRQCEECGVPVDRLLHVFGHVE